MLRLLLLFFLSFPSFVKAQQYNQYAFRHIDEHDGLLNNSVYSIMQDHLGYMWIGTPDGLQRYDGLRFKNYEKQLQALSYSIPIKTIYEDKENNIWVTSSDIACLNTLNNTAKVYNGNSFFENSEQEFVTYTDYQNNEWLLSKYSLYYIDSLSGKIKLFALNTPQESSTLGNVIYHDRYRKCTWVTNSQNLMMFDEKTKKIYTSYNNPTDNPVLKAFAGKLISFIMVDSKQNIWAAEWGSSIYKFDAKEKTFKQYQTTKHISQNKPSKKWKETVTTLCMYEDSHGTIWIGYDLNGLFRYDDNNDSLQVIFGKGNDQTGLQYNYSFTCITEDHDGNLWLGTDKGINIFNPYDNYFYNIKHEENNAASLLKNEVTSFLQSSGHLLFMGTWGGGFSIYDSLARFKKTILPKGPYEYPLIWCITENDDKTIWAGAQHGYLHIYDPNKGNLKTIHPIQMENSTIRCMMKDNSGNIWFGLHNGKVAEWEKRSGTFIPTEKSNVENLSAVKNIFIDNKGNIWISTNNGLLQFDPLNRKYIARYLISDNESYQTCSNEINGMEQENDSILIVGTMRSGFFFFNTDTKQFRRYNSFPDATATNIYAIKKDAENNVWMTTDYHIYELRHKDSKLLKYNLPNGLMNASFVMLNIYPMQNGNWLTASKTEAVIFNPAKITSTQKRNETVVITGFKIFDKEMNIDSLLHNNKVIRLNSDQNFPAIEFTTNSYAGIAKNIFYKLSGIDKDWVTANDKGIASYTNLLPGDYTFNIKAGEDANSPVTILNIVIVPPFYATWWFKGIVILFSAIIIYFFIKRRIQNIRYKAELRHKVSETEMLALRSQMNPHFIFNCLTAIDNLIQTNQPDKATAYLSRFAKLIRSVLESTKHNFVPFYKDFETLKLYIELEQFRFGNKFNYTVHADEELMEGDYKIPPLLVQPFVENAIHHGLMNKLSGERNLSINASLQSDYIQYTIKDNGVGRIKALELKRQNKPEHNSYGIEISSQRIQLHNQNGKQNNIIITDLYNDDKATGTQIVLNIKIDNP
jgi:ligand-binding sensor domain-containing protein